MPTSKKPPTRAFLECLRKLIRENRMDDLAVAEADFCFRRVDIDVNLGGINLQPQEKRRMLPLGEKGPVAVVHAPRRDT